jgi:TP901 family phage tail tape measure protein
MSRTQLDAILKLVDVEINPAVFRKISQSVAGMSGNLQKTSQALGATNSSAKALNSTLGRTGSQLSQNERAARLFLRRMAQFAILLPTFVTLNRAIQGGVKFLFDFDSALRDIVRIDIKGLEGQMEEIGEAALRTAEAFGVSAIEVLNVTRIFKQAGFTIEESQAKAQAAILATQISTLNSAQAVEVFIAAAKQFGDEGSNAVLVLDKLAKVEDLAAVNAADVAEAFRTGGNALAEFSKSLDDSIGLIAALREQTRKSGREIGTFFKTLQARIFAAGESRSAVEALGVSVQNLDGTLRPTLDVLNDLSRAFDGLTEAQQANAAKAIAGIRQFESLTATFNSLDRANELSAKSSLAAGTADEKRRITDQKLERQIQKLIAVGQSFAESLGDAGITDTISAALKLTTSLLKVFTKVADVAGDIGINLAPLLALGGVALGKGILGFGGGKGGGGGSRAAGAPTGGMIGPQLPPSFQKDMQMFSTNVKLAGTVAKTTATAIGSLSTQAVSNLSISQALGIQRKTNAMSFSQHTAAIKSDIAALKASALSQKGMQASVAGSSAKLLGLTLIAGSLPKAFDAVGAQVGKLGGTAGAAGEELLHGAGGAASMAAQFAFLGPQAAAVAGIFGLLQTEGVRLIEAWQEHTKAVREMADQRLKDMNAQSARDTLLGQGPNGQDAIDAFIDTFTQGLKGKGFGNELNAAITNSLSQLSKSSTLKDFNLSLEQMRDIVLGNDIVLQNIIATRKEEIQQIAEDNNRLETFNELMRGVETGTLTNGKAFALLAKVMGAGITDVNEFTGQLQNTMMNLENFKATKDIIDLADNIRNLNLELELAKSGPDALADSLVRLQNELLVAERASRQTGNMLREELNASIKSLGQKSFLTGDNGTLNNEQFMTELFKAIETVDTDKIERFKDIIRSIPNVTEQAAEDVLKAVEKQIQNEIEIQNKRNDVTSEINRRTRLTNDQAAEAALNAQAATAKFSAELKQFGENVNSELSQVQELNLDDVQNVLSGQSDLSQGIQELIQNAFGSPIQKAQTELTGVTVDTQAELGILARKLEDVNRRLAEANTFEEQNSLSVEQRSLQLEIERTVQQGLIRSTEAKIKVLQAEQEFAKDAAEAEKKRLDQLEKIADAARDFSDELRKVNEGFDDFLQDKFSDLLSEEADAQGELKDAQQETLNSTRNLADAYSALLDAQLEFGNVLAEAKIKINLIQRDIGLLTGSISSFDGQLSAISNAFGSVLNDANITLEKRIDLERQLAEETLSFLQQAQQEIQQAGLTVFGQSGQENQALAQGIQGLQFIVDQLGGSFDAFLGMSSTDFDKVSQSLLSLPLELRQQILDALGTLPSSTSIGGFTVEQLQSALGQIGAGSAPDQGIVSLEELTSQQVEQMKIIQDLTLQQAQLQFAQVAKAEQSVALAEQQLEAAKILEERTVESLQEVRDNIIEETSVLEAANTARQELLSQVIAADDKNTLMQLEKEAQLFADQNAVFKEVGNQIVQGVGAAIGAKLQLIEAQAALGAATGHIPNIRNFARGNLSPGEAAGILKAAMREKRAMPGGASLAVANTSEAIIPMNKGYIPNFQDGNLSPIAAGIEAIKAINETVVAAIARSVTQALADLGGDNGTNQADLLSEIANILSNVQGELEDISSSNLTISSNTSATTDTGAAAPTSSASNVKITLQTNQQNSISISGLENLTEEIRSAVRDAATEQADAQIEPLLQELDSIVQVLRERGLLSSFGQPG